MFGLSFSELVIIAILALLLLGPDKLPDAAKTLAKVLKDLRRASEDLKEQIGTELNVLEDTKRTVTGALAGALADATLDPAKAPPPPPREPPPAAEAGNVPGLEAALVEPEPPAAAPNAPTEPPGSARP